MRQSALNTGRREGCRLAARSALRIISTYHVVHPLPLRGIPLKGTQDVTGLASCPHSHSERSEESWYAAYLRQSALNTGQREAAAFGGPPIPLRGTSPKGKHVTGFSVASGSLRIQFLCHPAGGGRTTRAQASAAYEQPASQSFVVPLPGENGGAIHQRGLAAAGSIYTHRRQRRRYHNPQRRSRCQTNTLGAKAPSILRTLTAEGRVKPPTPRVKSPVNLGTPIL